MNEIVTGKLTDYLEKLEQGAQKGVDILQEEVPLYVQELLSWMFVENIFNIITSLMWIIGAFLFSYMLHIAVKSIREDEPNNEGCYVIYAANIFPLIAFCIATSCAFDSAKQAVKIKVAPRVVVVEEISKLVNQAKK